MVTVLLPPAPFLQDCAPPARVGRLGPPPSSKLQAPALARDQTRVCSPSLLHVKGNQSFCLPGGCRRYHLLLLKRTAGIHHDPPTDLTRIYCNCCLVPLQPAYPSDSSLYSSPPTHVANASKGQGFFVSEDLRQVYTHTRTHMQIQ